MKAFIFSLVFMIGNNGWAQESMIIDITKKIVKPEQYVVYKTKERIDIDGKVTEKDWEKIPFTKAFIDIEGLKIPKYKTVVKMLWDDRCLYIYAQLEEPHIWGDLKKHDAVIFYNNDFEVFIDPTDDVYNYTEIEVNALNTTWDLLLDKPYRFGGHANNFYEIKDLETAVYIDGTLNDASDIDRYWAVEMAIPFDVLSRSNWKRPKRPKDGDYWRVNFSRVQWEHELEKGKYSRKKVDGKFLPEYNWVWSNQAAINMHIPERWGYLEFTNNPVSEQKEPTLMQDDLSKQVAYALLESIKFGAAKKLLKTQVGSSVTIETMTIKEQRFEAVFTKTHLGFEIYLHNKTAKKRFAINELGQFRKLKASQKGEK